MMTIYPNAHAVQLKSNSDKMIQAQDEISGVSETNPNLLHRTTRRIWAFTENPNTDSWGFTNTWEGAVFCI